MCSTIYAACSQNSPIASHSRFELKWKETTIYSLLAPSPQPLLQDVTTGNESEQCKNARSLSTAAWNWTKTYVENMANDNIGKRSM